MGSYGVLIPMTRAYRVCRTKAGAADTVPAFFLLTLLVAHHVLHT